MQNYSDYPGVGNILNFKNSLITIISQIVSTTTITESFSISNEYFGMFYGNVDDAPSIFNSISINYPVIEFSACINSLKEKSGSNNNFLVGSLNFTSSLISIITQNSLKSTSVHGVIYDSTSSKFHSLNDCGEMNLYFPDPNYHSITEYNLTLLKSKSVNHYDQSDPFYNNRCVQFYDETRKVDITLNDRRKYYMSQVSLSCINYNPETLRKLTECSLVVVSNGFIKCSCSGDLGEVSLAPIDPKPMKEINPINLDVMGCPVLWSYYKQPNLNAGMIFSIIFLGIFVILSILYIFFLNDRYLIKNHKSSLYHNDCITHSQNYGIPDLENIQHAEWKYQDKAAPKIGESESNVVNAVKIIASDSINSNNKQTARDYLNLTNQDKLTKDKRSFLKYFWDQLTHNHIILLTFYKKSLLTSPKIRIVLFAFYIAIIFILNAMFYTDTYIEDRSFYNTMVKFY